MTMERKIGEIFEYNGEWYQCMKGNTCKDCAFYRSSCGGLNGKGGCIYDFREDATNVIFKKLEKVGEPYSDYCPSGRVIYFQRYKCYQKPVYTGNMIYWADDINISIEIKQNKEDMEEKNNGNTPLNVLTDKYVNGDICYDDFEKEVKALYSCKEEIKPTLKEFDLEAAKAGKLICTRDGRKARIICFDKKGTVFNGEEFPIVALLCDKYSNKEIVLDFTKYGKSRCNGYPSNCELMMLPEKKEGWVNIVRGSDGKSHMGRGIFQSKEEAEYAIKAFSDNLIDTIKIKWTE